MCAHRAIVLARTNLYLHAAARCALERAKGWLHDVSYIRIEMYGFRVRVVNTMSLFAVVGGLALHTSVEFDALLVQEFKMLF